MGEVAAELHGGSGMTALLVLRRHWLAAVVLVLALAVGWQMQRAATAEAAAAATKLSAVEAAQVASEKTIAELRDDARRRDLVLAGMRTLRARDRKELDVATSDAASAKGTARNGELAPISRDHLRRVRRQQN